MDCFWCIKENSSNVRSLKKLCSVDTTLQLSFDMKKDLIDCYDCVAAYHNAKDLYLVKHEQAEKELLAWEVDRLSSHLKRVLYPKPNDDTDTENIDYLFQEDSMPEFFGFGDGGELQSKLSIPLQEMLNFPYLLWNKGLAKLAVKGLLSLEEAGSPLIIDGKLPGIYLLLIHPSVKIRKWARKSVNFLGSISCDDYDDLSQVVNWIMGVYEFGLFQCPELGDDIPTQSSYTILPSHLFVQDPIKEFWLGVCMLLKALEVNTIRLQLVSHDHHPEFVRVVVTALDHANSVDKKTANGPDSEFWPVLHCFIILVERLGPRIWQHVQILMKDVFYLIVNHPSYRDELMRWPGIRGVDPPTSSTSDEYEDGAVSSSQMVYNWDGRRRRSSDLPRTPTVAAQPGKRKTVVFALFKPYLKSVVDFGDVGKHVVKNILKYLHHLKAEFEIPSLGYESIMSALMGCVDLLLKANMYSLLPIASDLWITDVIEILSSEYLQKSRCHKLAKTVCKSILERLSKAGANVTSLLASFDNKSNDDNNNNPTSLDTLTLHQLKEMLEKHFKCNRTSPSSLPRFFERERRMILIPGKQRRRDTDSSDKERSSSDELPLKQECKFIMLPKCRTSEVSREIEKIIAKKPCATVSPRQRVQPSKNKEKSILNYCNRSPLFDAKVPVQKLNVRKKTDREGKSSDVLVVDDSDDFMSDNCKKKDNVGGNKFKSPKLSLKSKRKKSKKVVWKEPAPMSPSSPSSDSSTSLTRKVSLGKFNEKDTSSETSCGESSRPATDDVKDKSLRPANGDIEEFPGEPDDSDGDFLASVNRLIDINMNRSSTILENKKPYIKEEDESFEELRGKSLGIERENQSVQTATVKSEKSNAEVSINKFDGCIVISDDSSAEDHVVDIAVAKESPTGPCNVLKKEEGSDESWDMIKDDIDFKVKDEPAECIIPQIKIEKSHADSSLDAKPEIKIEVDWPDSNEPRIKDEPAECITPQIKIEKSHADSSFDAKPEIKNEENDIKTEKASPTWSPAGDAMSDSEFCFNGDDNWDVIVNDDYNDLLMSCVDFNDPLDTMTCVEADLSESPDEEEILLISDEDDKTDSHDDVIDVSDMDDITLKTNLRKENEVRQDDAIVLSTNTDDVRSDNETIGELEETRRPEPRSADADEVRDVSRAERAAVVSDSSSPEQLKGSCLGAMFAKLKSVVKGASHLGVNLRQEAIRDDGDLQIEQIDVGVKGEGNCVVSSGHGEKDEQLDKDGFGDKNRSGDKDGSDDKDLSGDKDRSGDKDGSDDKDLSGDKDGSGDKDLSGDKDGSGDKSTSKDIDVDVENNHAVEEEKTADSNVDAKVGEDHGQAGFGQVFSKHPPGKKSVSFDVSPALAQATPPRTTTSTDFQKSARSKAAAAAPKTPCVVETKPKNALTIHDFHRKILNWDANLLFKTPTNPPNIHHNGRVPRTFNSMDDYYKVFKPLVLLELWAQVTRDWPDRKEHSMVVDSVSNFETCFQLIQCKKRLRVDGNLCEPFLHENTLVVVEIKDNVTPTRVFASVERVIHERGRWQPGDERFGGTNDGGQYFEFTITLRMLTTARRPVARETLHCIVVTSLVNFIRQWKALIFLPRSLLARDVLSPRVNYCGTSDRVNKKLSPPKPGKVLGYNDSQQDAIERTSEAMQKPFPIPRTCFIQGPPGTGKSHTVIGLIKQYLKNCKAEVQSERENQLPGCSSTLSQSSGRILLCAPSNAAIDVLVRRLVADMRADEGNLGPSKGKNCGSINLVRVGRFSAIHPQVLPFTLDVLCKTELAKLSAGDVTKEQSVKVDLEDIRAKIDRLEKKSFVLQCSSGDNDKNQVNDLKADIGKLVQKKHQIERRHRELRARSKSRRQQETKIKKDVLLSADVLCCTLSGSGSQILHNNLLKNKRKCPPFGCIIVDEACQSCELDVLIPLQFGCSKLVLVGDPEQLRTTILSQKAQELQFGQSLYERHYRVFRERAKQIEGCRLHMTKDNPIQMLDVQYRMHPDIAAFPSSHVYQGRLKNAKNVITRQSVCDLKPYIILNVLNGKEQSSSNASVCNPVECNLIIEICFMLRKSLQEKHFGIVTPYRAQVRLVERSLRERGMEKIEVNTVDGFQGREKEIIIMSCVRSSGQERGIGFLADRQRMNVALTRARHSLIILLSASSLQTNKDWKACIDDASKRGLLHDIQSLKDINVAFQKKTIVGVATLIRSPSSGNPTQDKLSVKGVECDGNKLSDIARIEEEEEKGGKTKVDDRRKQRENGNTQRETGPGENAHQEISSAEVIAEKTPTSCRGLAVVADSRVENNCKNQDSSTAVDDSVPSRIARERDSVVVGTVPTDPRKRKSSSGHVTESCGSDNRREDKKRRIEDGSNVAEQRSCDTSRYNRPDDVKSRKNDGGHFKGRTEEEKKKKRDTCDGKSSNSEKLHRKVGSTSNKRKCADKNEERKRRKEREIATITTNHPPTIPDILPSSPRLLPPIASDRRPSVSDRVPILPDRPTTAHDNSPSGLVPSSAASDQHGKSKNVDGLTAKSQDKSQTDDFDFDEYESDLCQNSCRREKASENLYLNEVCDRLVHSGGILLAQNDPYLNQLASHEQRVKLARSTSVPSSAILAPSFVDTLEGSTAGKEIPKELLRTFSNPTTDSSTATWHGRPTKPPWRTAFPQQTHHAQRDDRFANRQLDSVVQRVKSNNPTKPPPPLMGSNDSLASFRRYHGGPRQRVAARPLQPKQARGHRRHSMTDDWRS